MLPTVRQIYAMRTACPRRRVDTSTPRHALASSGGDLLGVQAGAEVESARSMYFLPLRARKAVVVAGQVRDGP